MSYYFLFFMNFRALFICNDLKSCEYIPHSVCFITQINSCFQFLPSDQPSAPARPIESAAAALHTWPTRQQELADEANDAQLLQAVQQSMRTWKRSHAQKQQLAALEERRRRRRRRRRAAPATVTASQQPSGTSEKSVCYGDLGCFEDSGPFGYLDMLPSPPEEINTRFMFYSTKNR